MKLFYVYLVFELCPDGSELPLYVGKGHDDTVSGYSRMLCYVEVERNQNTITRAIKEKLAELVTHGRAWGVKKLADASDELGAFLLEKKFIAEIGIDRLLNCCDGGSFGWTLKASSKKKMSDARKGRKLGPASETARLNMSVSARRAKSDPGWRESHSRTMRGRKPTDEHLASRRRGMLAASAEGRIGRPAGTNITADEAAELGFPGPGKFVLTESQHKKWRRIKYHRSKVIKRKFGTTVTRDEALAIGLLGSGQYHLTPAQHSRLRSLRYAVIARLQGRKPRLHGTAVSDAEAKEIGLSGGGRHKLSHEQYNALRRLRHSHSKAMRLEFADRSDV